MKKPDWKIVNAALWTELILSYFFPFKAVDGCKYRVGVPLSFITIYDSHIGINPFASMHLDPIGFLADAVLIYWGILVVREIYQKIKSGKRT